MHLGMFFFATFNLDTFEALDALLLSSILLSHLENINLLNSCKQSRSEIKRSSSCHDQKGQKKIMEELERERCILRVTANSIPSFQHRSLHL